MPVMIDSGPPPGPRKWPSREEWAEGRRTPYSDNCPRASETLSLYATPDEVQAIITGLKRSYSASGHQMRQMKTAYPDLITRLCDSRGCGGFLRLSDDEQKCVEPFMHARWNRKEINRALKMIAKDDLPMCEEDGGHLPEFAEVLARYEKANAAVVAAWQEKIAQSPIDDAAWEAELDWRRRVDARS